MHRPRIWPKRGSAFGKNSDEITQTGPPGKIKNGELSQMSCHRNGQLLLLTASEQNWEEPWKTIIWASQFANHGSNGFGEINPARPRRTEDHAHNRPREACQQPPRARCFCRR